MIISKIIFIINACPHGKGGGLHDGCLAYDNISPTLPSIWKLQSVLTTQRMYNIIILAASWKGSNVVIF